MKITLIIDNIEDALDITRALGGYRDLLERQGLNRQAEKVDSYWHLLVNSVLKEVDNTRSNVVD